VKPGRGVYGLIGKLKDGAVSLRKKPKAPSTALPAIEEFPLLPLRGLVLFPNTVVPVFIAYRPGIDAVEEALRRDCRLFAVCLGGGTEIVHSTGTVVRIIQQLRLPDNTYRVVLQGEYRGTGVAFRDQDSVSLARVQPIQILGYTEPPPTEFLALMRSVQKAFAKYAEFSRKISADTVAAVEKAENPERLANLASNAMAIKVDKKIELLSIPDLSLRLETLLETLETENEIFGIQKNINVKIKSRMEKGQREYFLHEQLKEINRELGTETVEDEFADLEKALFDRKPPEEVLAKAQKELKRLRKLQSLSPEAGVLRGYLEWIADLPWSEYSSDLVDLVEAEKILEEDHYNMRKAKERILEFIAVMQIAALGAPAETPPETVPDADPPFKTPNPAGVRGPILCFVGPPGTGKTSLGKSVARALGRRFVRISLGGVRDEAEIRGHRKTYVGALPGKIIQSMRKALTMNPVILLDEIDKLSSDFRGDPASALLEVLDPEQNFSFTDHYLELPYDLSKVLFITTANSLHTIPYPLLDRMEIIEVPGYGENEKLAIAKRFLVPKELEENGLKDTRIGFRDDALLEIVRHWTMESGVRGLEREIARCIRRLAREAVEKNYGKDPEKPLKTLRKTVRKTDLEKLLGRRKYKNDLIFKDTRVGVCYGLAWTETGGAMLPVETRGFPGSGELIITGNLGDVMKESARIALSHIRSFQGDYNFSDQNFDKLDFHVHVPEGAIPKDGPSAGITLASSLLSSLCRTPPAAGTAMTGELTLTGRILPIGGLKEKLLAAVRNGMERVLLPLGNREDWEELDRDLRDALKADFVENTGEAFRLLFGEEILQKESRAGLKRPKPRRPVR
jgi:ATP-dependent Lon protease